jgi:MYXO-CTERM domain-containing protein
VKRLRTGSLALALLWPSVAQASATFEIVETDDGLSDPTPRTPEGGNPGTTLGEQRRRMLDRTIATWAKYLDSEVPIEVEVYFEEMGCDPNGYTVAATTPGHWISIRQPDGKPLVYPSALANRLLGIDRYPDAPDFRVGINSSLDTSRCRNMRAYYGFEAPPPRSHDNHMLAVLLHEFAHGLGFASSVYLDSGGTMSPDGPDVFSAHIRDLDLDRTWAELSNDERKKSAVNVRRLVFDGPETHAVASRRLSAGAISLTFEPAIAGFSGWISDTDFGQSPAQSPVSGVVTTTYGADLCNMRDLRANQASSVLLIEDTILPSNTGCSPNELFERARVIGVAALVLPFEFNDRLPVPPLDGVATPVALPIVVVSNSDAATIARAAPRGRIVASLGSQKEQLEGADSLGRPLLYATAPIARGSSISHFDTLARPDLLMEASASGASVDDLDLTVPVLRDLGWTVLCGNGRLDGKEACDEGESNDDRIADRCRTSCKRPSCGDGVADTSEACDNGSQNSDATPGACRTTCVTAHCGDGVFDPGESCDQGATNGGTAKGACRLDCTMIGCGDGVLDPGEACDHGKANSDTVADACRTSCRAPTCGDRVVDTGEACDGELPCTAHCALDTIAPWRPVEHSPIATIRPAHGDGCSVGGATPSGVGPLTLLLAAHFGRARRRRRY